MKYFVLLLALFNFGCSGGGGDSSASTDPMVGTWYYEAPGTTSTSARGYSLVINSNKTFELRNMYVAQDGGTLVVVYRLSKGSYVRDGDNFKLTYSYETCNPIKEETVQIRLANDKLGVYDPTNGITLVMARSTESSTFTTAALKEDKDCTILSKLQKDSKRVPASNNKPLFKNTIL